MVLVVGSQLFRVPDTAACFRLPRFRALQMPNLGFGQMLCSELLKSSPKVPGPEAEQPHVNESFCVCLSVDLIIYQAIFLVSCPPACIDVERERESDP